jgi:ABC-type transport system involved in multi-copper enzyme maturation permease subunit
VSSPKRNRNYRTLWVLIGAALLFGLLFVMHHPLIVNNKVDGLIAVVFGLYICSHPAANFLDMLLYRRSSLYQPGTTRSELIWLAFNLLVIFIGWFVIFMGTTRLTAG